MKKIKRRTLIQHVVTSTVPIATADAVAKEAGLLDNRFAHQPLPPLIPNTVIVNGAPGTSRESKPFRELRDLIDLPGRFNTNAPYVSQMERFRQLGISPEDVDHGNEISNGADAAIPLREMF